MSERSKKAEARKKEEKDKVKTVQILTPVIVEGNNEFFWNKLEVGNDDDIKIEGSDEGKEKELTCTIFMKKMIRHVARRKIWKEKGTKKGHSFV